MTSTINVLDIRRRLGRKVWGIPREFGPDGWIIDHMYERTRIVVTVGPLPLVEQGNEEYKHASISHEDRMPTYEDLIRMHAAIWPTGYAYQIFAPPSDHINIHEFALHLWGLPDGKQMLPDFGALGTI